MISIDKRRRGAVRASPTQLRRRRARLRARRRRRLLRHTLRGTRPNALPASAPRRRDAFWKAVLRKALLVGAALLLAASLGYRVAAPHLIDRARFAQPRDSLTITDRNGLPLRHTRPRHGGIATDQRWVSLDDISPVLIAAFLAAEDQRFDEHAGIDYAATLRALASHVVPGVPRSGGSTITQQTIKLVYGRPHGRASKPLEMLRALALEEQMSKRFILEQYLNRVPFGDQIVGIGRASEAYFGVPPDQLRASQAALLAGVPRAPSVTEPRRHRARAFARQREVLRRMHRAGMLTMRQRDAALADPPSITQGHTRPWRAPRFVDRVLEAHRRGAVGAAARTGPRRVRTTLDLSLQRRAEDTLQRAVARLAPRGVENAAAIAVHNDTGEVLAYVAAARSGADAPGGQLDLLRARRQPGSTLKPFVYGLFFEGGGTASSVLADVSWTMTGAEGALFTPEDYDGRERGPVRAREALAGSLNLAALDAARQVGAEAIVERLRALGIGGLGRAERYGAAIALGGADVRPIDLARAYLALARGGTAIALRFTPAETPDLPEGRRVLPPLPTAVLLDVLRDGAARDRAFGASLEALHGDAPFGLKTGTSSGFRDAWAAAFDEDTTVVVWLGDPRGRPLAEVSGFEAAAPLAARLLSAAQNPARVIPHRTRKPDASLALSEVRVCPLSGLLVGPDCRSSVRERFVPGTEPQRSCPFHDDGGVHLPRRYEGWRQRAGWSHATTTARLAPERDLGERSPREGNLRQRVPRERVSDEEHLALAAPNASAAALEIIRPKGEWVVDVERPPLVTPRARRGAELVHARWWIDGEPLQDRWRPSPGVHRVVAEAPDGARAEASVRVVAAR